MQLKSLMIDDSITEAMFKKSNKKRIERHRFADKPENPRALHNKKLYDDFQSEMSMIAENAPKFITLTHFSNNN
jgi:hypothetical protein